MNPQQTIAHYRIMSKLGEGGMGEVWRATDTKLDREVAIKILPEALAQDLDRMARFEREAKVLASLNHPNIAAIHGVEERALVMELVDGPTLAERIVAGPMSVDEALGIARQIAEAVEYAHERGVIHRDLKPANIKITPEGRVKVLDFGLAKAISQVGRAEAPPLSSPTLTMQAQATQMGVIMGTAAYMSPEQARGQNVDKRADIWSFGVVLYEMLAGSALFGGETVTDILASVVKETPDWKALPSGTPPRIRRLIERCLRKDPKTRLQAIGEARIAIDEPESESLSAPGAPAQARPKWLVWILAAVALAAMLAAVAALLRPRVADVGIGPVRLLVSLPEGTNDPGTPAAAQAAPSPDGRSVAFTVRDGSGLNILWVRRLDSLSPHRLDKTEGAHFPFWSPDSRFIAFFTEDKLKKIALDGGLPQSICDLPRSSMNLPPGAISADGGTWNRDGVIVFGQRLQHPLMRVLAAGGLPAPVTTLDKTTGERAHIWPQFLPDGKHLLYLALGANPEDNAIYAQELGSAQRILVMKNPTHAAWSPPGYLVFVREGTLMAQRMDARTLRLEGEAVSVAPEVTENTFNGRSAFAISDNGVLAYRGGLFNQQHQLIWLDRDGKNLGLLGKSDFYLNVRLSPDEKRAAVAIGSLNQADTWIVDLATGVPTRMTSDGTDSFNLGPWSPDSQRLAVNSLRGGIRELIAASGKLTPLSPDARAEDWSPDGRALLCNDQEGKQLSLLLLAPGSKPRTILETPYRKTWFRFSRDGKWVVYSSAEPGHEEIFVASFPDFAVKKQVSSGGGMYPEWQKDGKAVYFRGVDGSMMSADVRTGATLEIGPPKPLFKWGLGTLGNHFSVTRDGRFLVNELKSRSNPGETIVIVNWLAALPLVTR